MPTVATYYQLQDTEIDLRVGGDVDRTFTQSIPVDPVSGEGAMVSWVARRKASGSVNYDVTLNGALLNSYTLNTTDKIAIQETTSTSNVTQGDNELIFLVTGGTGTLGLGDVMLWHRVNA